VAEPRVGLGFDVHPRASERSLSLGGVAFAGEPRLAGHSDGDAVCHAVAAALLGAAALGDLGQHFPEDDPSIDGIAGLELLGRVVATIGEAGFAARSCDVTVICERPAIAARRDEMRATLSRVLGLRIDRVSVKATRPEGLGLSGDGVGCLALVAIG